MARRGSTMTDVSLRLDDALDRNGQARLALAPSTTVTEDSTIAPWIDVPPTPPPKTPTRSFGFPPKSSIASFVQLGQSSSGSLTRHNRPSESQSTLSIAEANRRSLDDGESSRGPFNSGSSTYSGELRKPKSSLNLNVFSRLRSRSSKVNLGPTELPSSEHPSLRTPAPPLPNASFLSLTSEQANASLISLAAPLIKTKREKKKKNSQSPPSPPPKDDESSHIHHMDVDLNKMDGIIDLSLHSGGMYSRDFSSPSSGAGSDYGSVLQHASLSSADFSNPFSQTSTSSKRKAINFRDQRKVSPKTTIPSGGMSISHFSMPSSSSGFAGGPGSPTWTPPESWAVEKEGEEALEAAYSSSEDSAMGINGKPLNGHEKPMPIPHTVDPLLAQKNGRKRRHPKQRSSLPGKVYRIRIYRANTSYHVVSAPLTVTVADLTPALNQKLLLGDDRVQHRLYLDEGGRERILASTERPANIVRRRLEQAGYDPADNLEELGGGELSFLLKFCYKTQLLGPPEEELTFENFDFIDLTGLSLRTIPVVLHLHADSIISLKLSRNPMLEIPLDFIQSCSTLRELRLSNMAMKKVPQSVRHSSTLHRLDLSSNRISDLDEAYLEHITGLLILFVQNNKLEKIPWHFPRLKSLTTLNISNNKFATFPKELTKLDSLRDLDISFNMIKELPEEIGLVKTLERLVIVGNQVSKFPDECCHLINLRVLDCRRNQLSDLTVICMLPNIHNLMADHNVIHALDLSLGSNLTTLDVSHNDITQLSLIPGPIGKCPYALTTLDLSYAKLSYLDDLALSQLSSLRTLKLDHNSFRFIPDALGDLSWLETLSCSDNRLDALPASIGRLQKLETLDAHNNNLTELPQTLWNCASLTRINVTSNFLGSWHDPPVANETTLFDDALSPGRLGRKTSTASVTSTSGLPPLVHSLEKLYLGENRLTDDALNPLMIFKELRILNLSFNEIQDLPPTFFRNMVHLEELYLSGNRLTSIPTEDLHRLKRLSTLYLNGNKLQTLPQELGKVKDLSILDVGSNLLKYNINNWEFDWNWNFNKKLKYLNLSGNKRLQIKSETARTTGNHRMSRDLVALGRQTLSGFKDLTSLRVLGIMDVTITTTGVDTTVDIPDETECRRVRTSLSTVNGMAYGIADSLGRNDVLTMLDLVHEFPGRSGESGKAIFAMFGRAQPPKGLLPSTSPNRLAKYLHDNFVDVFVSYLHSLNPSKGEGVPDALRRTFLKLNQNLHHYLTTQKRKNSQASGTATAGTPQLDPAVLRTGASGIVVYFVEQTMYVANAGNALAVVSRQGVAQSVSRKHDPYDREETARIRSAEGWVSSSGLVNDEVDVSRSFGYFNLLPVVNARPDISLWKLTELDEFVIVANRGLWDFVPYQTAVDIARTVARTERPDPMIAAQKLRDFAISYGADGSTMIMVIWVSDLFKGPRSRQATLENIVAPIYRSRKKDEVTIKETKHLQNEVPAPTGHLALVFTDIRNSTHLWEANPGMPTAMRLHNGLLRRQLRFCGGYEVKTEGDAFMVSFPTALAAVWWCLSVQNQLLQEPWPLEILECEDGKSIYDDEDRLLARGLSVRMGIHSGFPVCEPDPITHRMDYFGSMVNRSARINSSAAGGQIMISADILREINVKILEVESESEYSKLQPQQAIDAIRLMGVVVFPVGEVKLKGFEFTEVLSAIYPTGLQARHDLKEGPINPTGSASRVQFSVPQTQELGLLCLRLEALAAGRIFRVPPIRKQSIQSISVENEQDSKSTPDVFVADPELLLPPMTEQSSDTDLMLVLDSLSVRIQNSITTLVQRLCPPQVDKNQFLSALLEGGALDSRTLEYITSILQNM